MRTFLLLLFVALTAAVIAQSPRMRVGSYDQEVRDIFTTAHGLPSDDVFSVVTLTGEVFAGTAEGLARFRDDRWDPVDGFTGGPATVVAAPGSELAVVFGRAIHTLRDGEIRAVAELPEGVTVLRHIRGATVGDATYVATARGLFVLQAGRLLAVGELNALLGAERRIRAVAASPGGRLAVAAGAGLFERSSEAWRALHPADGRRSWAPRDVRGVSYDSSGGLWFASPQGIGHRGDRWRLYTGEDGLPYDDFTTAEAGPRGAVWFGTRIGAVRFDGRVWEYRQGKRWLPDDDIRAIAVDSAGQAWFATSRGVGRIRRRKLTLAAKARFFEGEIEKRHRRTQYGFVLSVRLDRAGDSSSWHRHDSDNDGLWTSMYGAAQCFAYGATRDPTARRRARAAFEALRFLGLVTQGGSHPAPAGFVARTILPTSRPDPNVGSVERDREMKRSRDRLWKIINPRWPISADGKWYWKCDTSSDELDGHFFFYALYHDLVAESEEEKARVREVILDIADHLIAHDFNLVDHDGLPTRWARFGPDDLNHDPDWWEERGLNSLSILSYLKVAEHVSGSRKYAAAADELIRHHGYLLNVMYPKNQKGPGSGNQSDDEMAFMGYYNLMKYEKDPERREVYAYSFYRYWQLERPELNPLFDFMYAAFSAGESWRDPWGTKDLSPRGEWLAEAVDSLKRYPLDRVNWRLTNSHRRDVVFLSNGRGGRRGFRRDGHVLPIDERYVEHWNHDPWRLDQGGDGRQLADGASFLLPYYLGLYHGFVAD